MTTSNKINELFTAEGIEPVHEASSEAEKGQAKVAKALKTASELVSGDPKQAAWIVAQSARGLGAWVRNEGEYLKELTRLLK